MLKGGVGSEGRGRGGPERQRSITDLSPRRSVSVISFPLLRNGCVVVQLPFDLVSIDLIFFFFFFVLVCVFFSIFVCVPFLDMCFNQSFWGLPFFSFLFFLMFLFRESG